MAPFDSSKFLETIINGAAVATTPTASALRPAVIVQPVPITVTVHVIEHHEVLAWFNDPVWVTAIATILLGGVTTLLWIFTGAMWWEARNARLASVEAVSVEKDAYTAEHKPVLKPILTFLADNKGRAKTLMIMIINDGASPARLKGYNLSLLSYNPFPSESFSLEKGYDTKTLIGTGGDVEFYHDLSTEMIEAVESSNSRIDGHLTVAYSDDSNRDKSVQFKISYDRRKSEFNLDEVKMV